MRNNIISPRFDEEQYKGQDVVHHGCRIPLSLPVDEILAKIKAKARQKIKTETGVEFRTMTNEDLPILKSMWFNPKDETFPNDLWINHHGITATYKGIIVGGAIWKQEGKNLFLHQLVAGEEGKGKHVPSKLIWESVKAYHGTSVQSLDIGVSYNPKRYQFFKQFAVTTYPIILKKPEMVPVIRLSPYRGFDDQRDEAQPMESYGKAKLTFLPRGVYAMYAALKHLDVGPGDVVTIVKTFGSDFISGCVTKMIEKTGATWALRDLDFQKTKAVIALHEFGVPVFQDGDMDMLMAAQKAGIPIIEDCAWRATKVWDWSTLAVFSLSKMSNMNYGAFLEGVYIDDDTLWSWGCLDVVKRNRLWMEPMKDVDVEKRIAHWNYYDSLVRANGMMFDDCINWPQAVNQDKWIPTVYMQKFESQEEAEAIVARLEQFGIQAGVYWGEPLVYLPIHQNMTTAEVEYMFAVVAGYYNSCRDYR